MNNGTVQSPSLQVLDSDGNPINLENYKIIAKDSQMIIANDLQSKEFVVFTGISKSDIFYVGRSYRSQIPVEAYLNYQTAKQQAELKSFCNFLNDEGIAPYNGALKTNWYERVNHE